MGAAACALGRRPGWGFQLAEARLLGSELRGLPLPLPKGKGLQGTPGFTQSPGLAPLALQVQAPGRCLGEDCAHRLSSPFFLPQKEMLGKQPIPIAEGWSRETWAEGVCTDVETEKPKGES